MKGVAHRVNISIDKSLHAKAQEHAQSNGEDFSGLITRLIIEDIRYEREMRLAESQIPLPKRKKPKPPDDSRLKSGVGPDHPVQKSA